MNRKIFFSSLSIFASLTLMTGTAFAAFTTTATAAGTTFSTTNPNLTVSLEGRTGTSIPGPHITGLVPGVPGPATEFLLINNDTEPSDTLTVSLMLPFTSENTLSGKDLTIDVVCNGNDYRDTYENWIFTSHTIGTVAPNGGTLSCTMQPTLNEGVGNEDIGKSAIFDAVFTGSVGL